MKSGIAACAVALAFFACAAHAESVPSIVSCKLIKTPAQLQAINTSDATRAGTYCLGNDIDMTGVIWKANGTIATHYMLGTLYTKSGNAVNTVIANDP